MTLNQIIKKKSRKEKIKKIKRPAISGFPQRKGIVSRVFIFAPKKPNSARRRVVRVRLIKTGRYLTSHIPGEGHNLQEHSLVLIHGGRAKDLPGVKYRVIRGKLDCMHVKNRKRALSRYGKPPEKKSTKRYRR